MVKQVPIVILHPHLLQFSGSTQVVLELAQRLQAEGREVTIVTVAYNPTVVAPYQSLRIQALGGPTTGSPLFWLTFPFFFYKLVKALKAYPKKIIFSHSLALYWGGLYKWLYPHTPTVHYYHDLGIPYVDTADEIASLPLVPRGMALSLAPLLRWIDRRLTKRVDALIANSNFTAGVLKQLYHRPVSTIVYPCANSTVFQPSTAMVKQDYVYTVGRLERVKHIEIIIEGFALYLQQHPEVQTKLQIIGSGVERDRLQQLATNIGIAERVTFRGSVSQVQVAEIASQAKLGIFMRANEPFGMAALEALLVGTPIVGPVTGGIGEIITTTSIGIAMSGTTTPQVLAGALGQALADRDRLQQWHSSAAQLGRRYFNWDDQVAKLQELFDTIST